MYKRQAYEDDDIIVINKPFDMPAHPSAGNHDNTLANALMYYYGSQNKPFVYRCINRLDRDTTGLTIVAKHALAGGIPVSYTHLLINLTCLI